MRGQSALDGFDPNANGTIRVVVVQPDGKILIGGDFTTLSPNGGAAVTRNHIARLNPDGTLDTAFNPNANGSVYAIAVQADGKILVGGDFTERTASADRRAIASPGSMPPPAWLIRSTRTRTVLSFPSRCRRTARFWWAAISTERTASADRRAIASPGSMPRPAWRIRSTRTRTAVSLPSRCRRTARFWWAAISAEEQHRRTDAQPHRPARCHDRPGGFVRPEREQYVSLSIAVQADGKILAGGNFSTNSIGGQTRNYIARLDATTGLADSFNPNANGRCLFHRGAGGRQDFGGRHFHDSIGGQTRNRIARLDPTTGLADSFDPNANGHVFCHRGAGGRQDSSGRRFHHARAERRSDGTRNRIARLETDGRLDQTLNLKHRRRQSVIAIAVQPDGKILIGGDFTTVLGVTRNNIARLNTDGTLDTAFNPNANEHCLCNRGAGGRQDSSGRRFHGQQHRRTDAQSHRPADATTGWLIRSTRTRTVSVHSIAVQADGKILVGGDFQRTSADRRAIDIARLDATTGLADSFNPNANDAVYSIAVQADGKILVGGDFTGEQHRRTDAQLHRPARCHDRPGGFVQPERERSCLCNRGAGGRQDFGGRRFHAQHRRTDAQLHRPARCHDRPGRFVQPERER